MWVVNICTRVLFEFRLRSVVVVVVAVVVVVDDGGGDGGGGGGGGGGRSKKVYPFDPLDTSWV